MSVRTEVDQSTGSKREPGLPQFSNRPFVVHASAGSWGVRLYGRSNRLQTEFEHFGRIRWADTGTCLWACLIRFTDSPGTSTFDRVDNVVTK